MEELDTHVVLTSDQKEVVQRRAKELFFVTKQLDDWVQSDSLTNEMKETLPNLAAHHLSDIKKAIGATGDESERFQEMTRSINEARNKRIEELEAAVANQNPLTSIREKLREIDERINYWWDVDGFNYISDIDFSGNAIKVKFGFQLDSFVDNYSDTPHTDKENRKSKLETLLDYGFVFAHTRRGEDKDLLDNEHNRALLIQMVQEKFPTCLVTHFENHVIMGNSTPDAGKYTLRYFEIYIYDFTEVENLPIKPKREKK